MNSRTKFRAWDKEDNKMWKVIGWSDEIWGWEDGKHIKVCKIDADSTDKQTDVRISVDYELMQWTGLVDKNGVKVYENDILRVWQEDEHVPNRDSGGGIIDYDTKEGFLQLGVVEFTGCSFSYETVKTLKGEHENIHIPIDWIENYEVVGNVYENSDLLEER